MGVKPYPAYKDSGVEWIGEIPEHWEVKRLKDVAECNSESLAETTNPELEIRYFEISDVSMELGISDHSFYSFASAPSRARRVVRHGDVLISTVRTYLKAITYVSLEYDRAITSTGFAVFRPVSILSMFLKYAVVAEYFIADVISKSVGISYPAIRSDELCNCLVTSPPFEEQKLIASFLDRETVKIDTLVAKQQQLITLLKEKRQSLISHTVTKGLNPNVRMKDSGVEWIGEIPEHWEVKRLKDVAGSVGVGLVINPSTYVLDFPSDEDVPMLLGSNVVPFGFNLKSVRRISPEDNLTLSASRLKRGDIVVVRVGAPGVAAVIPPDLDSSNCASVLIVRQHQRFEPHWLVYVLNSPVISSQVDIVKYGAAQKQFNVSHAVAFVLPSPPLEEQKQIAAFLDQETSKIDELVIKANQSIALLKERRSSLISAAVTGKIDVREAA
jgi:type I restriction enzyme S subunit